MAEIPGIPFEPRKTPRRKAKPKRVTTSLQWVERGPLVPWMYTYAQWLAEDPTAVLVQEGFFGKRPGPPWSQRTAKAGLIAKRKINKSILNTLEKRADFRAYFDKLRADHHFMARELAKGKIAKNLEARDAALDAVSGAVKMPDGTTKYLVQDPKAVEQFTRPFLELAFPKKEPEADRAPRVVIHLGTAAVQQLLGTPQEEPTDVSFEVIENPKALESGEED